MDNETPLFWFQECPELLDREKREMEQLGFILDERALETERVVRFEGRSRYNPQRRIIIIYRDGYPSIAPKVIVPVNTPSDALARHHDPESGVLCCFGFGDSQWNAGMEALDIVLAAERIIRDYPPGAEIPDDDLVPEPRVVHFAYAPGSSILIPPPFGDMTLEELRNYRSGQIRVNRESHQVRGILSHLSTGAKEDRAEPSPATWLPIFYKGQARNVVLRVLSEPPPYLTGYFAILGWLQSIKVLLRRSEDAWTLVVFPDEWGSRKQLRATWIAVHTAPNKAEWVRCYQVSRDDSRVRTPYGNDLAKCRILMVGCGSLGSAAGVALAQEGVEYLALVDEDVYEPGNSVRHQVGVYRFGSLKALALADRIRELMPQCQVSPLLMRVGYWNSTDRDKFFHEFQQADVVVDTTGNQSVAHYLNDLCTKNRKPLVIGSVTNGVWSAEVFRYRPGKSGCRMCWNYTYGDIAPPGAPNDGRQFAPGCNQPTFVGGAADVGVAGGLVARMVTETILSPDVVGQDYLVWTNRVEEGRWQPRVETFAVPPHPRCLRCRA
ncbi:hypothetical protein SY88_00390 [Clostridiales bacterium PH28_bin88]|nr:hypothetical protein SY88_00390 [Clostridiales bacterium PH28_bin88]